MPIPFDPSRDESTYEDAKQLRDALSDWETACADSCSLSDVGQRLIRQIREDADCDARLAAQVLLSEWADITNATGRVVAMALHEAYQNER